MEARNTSAASRRTVVGLFEDHIDAEHALLALRKADRRPEQVSLIVRDQAGERDGEAGSRPAIARALVGTALEAVGDWLQGLASLVVPERGTFLVAGPLGAALAGPSPSPDQAQDTGFQAATSFGLGPGGLVRTLVDFGFSEDEATYLAHRMEAGSTLIAVTADDREQVQAIRHLFADQQAVHIGAAQTEDRVVEEVNALLAAPPPVTQSGDIVVADSVAPLIHLCRDNGHRTSRPILVEHCGAEVVDQEGAEVGVVDDILTEAQPTTPGRNPEPRYVVLAFGGVFGIGRHHVALPAHLIDFKQQPARVSVDREILHHGPDYDTDTPLSRREERAICGYFGCTPYWAEDSED